MPSLTYVVLCFLWTFAYVLKPVSFLMFPASLISSWVLSFLISSWSAQSLLLCSFFLSFILLLVCFFFCLSIHWDAPCLPRQSFCWKAWSFCTEVICSVLTQKSFFIPHINDLKIRFCPLYCLKFSLFFMTTSHGILLTVPWINPCPLF